jgi:hypothetical protein
MKRPTVALVAALAALAIPSAAAAYTDFGAGQWTDLARCKSCMVYIHNNTTGANGSTTTDSSGIWGASGFVSGYSYSFHVAYFGIPGCSYTNSSTYTWTQTSSNEAVGNSSLDGHGNPGGCPIFPQG